MNIWRGVSGKVRASETIVSTRDLENETRELRARIATLVDEAATNERLLKRNQQRELELLKADTLAQFFEAICKGLLTSYGLESVTLLLCDPQHEIRHLLIADHLGTGDFPQVIFVDSLVGIAPQFTIRFTSRGSGHTWAAITNYCFPAVESLAQCRA